MINKQNSRQRISKSNQSPSNNLEDLFLPKKLSIEGLDCVLTYAGWQWIDYQLASEYFEYSQIEFWWEMITDWEQYGDFYDDFTSSSMKNFDCRKGESNREGVKSMINKYDFLPKKAKVVTVKAFYNSSYKWLKILSFFQPYLEPTNFDYYEAISICLADKLRKELGQENLLIINSNKKAVLGINGLLNYKGEIRFSDPQDINFINRPKTQVFWSPKTQVKLARNMKINQATKLILPSSNLEDF